MFSISMKIERKLKLLFCIFSFCLQKVTEVNYHPPCTKTSYCIYRSFNIVPLKCYPIQVKRTLTILLLLFYILLLLFYILLLLHFIIILLFYYYLLLLTILKDMVFQCAHLFPARTYLAAARGTQTYAARFRMPSLRVRKVSFAWLQL